jgi:hypothetical protein
MHPAVPFVLFSAALALFVADGLAFARGNRSGGR